MKSTAVSELTLRRFPKYLHFLQQLKKSGFTSTSASEIARNLDIHHTQVRKDLAATGVRGVPKVGHSVDDLIKAIKSFLNWDNTTDAFLVGAGNLGSALIGYNGFEKTGIHIISVFDNNPEKIGTEIEGIKVFDLEKMKNLVDRMKIHIGIITTPAVAAQQVADLMVESGILAIWNFTPVILSVPENIIVSNAEIYSSLAVLSRKLSNRIQENQ